MTTRTPTPPPLDDDLEALLRGMRLPHMRRTAPEGLATARAQRWEPAEVLRVLLTEEVAGRDHSSTATRLTAAGFPSGKTFDTWDPDLSSIPPPTQTALRTLEWLGRRENLMVCGPSGTGKTMFLEALDHGRRSRRPQGRLFESGDPQDPGPPSPRRRLRHPRHRSDPAGGPW